MIKARDKGFFEPLDEQERDLRDAVVKDALVPVSDQEEWKDKLVRAARATIAKNRHISIRLSESDIMLIRARALELGMPYQTLIGSILHQYAEGKVKTSF
jgi:predicted DNA binding CopG/RHH family protein